MIKCFKTAGIVGFVWKDFFPHGLWRDEKIGYSSITMIEIAVNCPAVCANCQLVPIYKRSCLPAAEKNRHGLCNLYECFD